MRTFGTTLSLIGAALLLSACEDPLSVQNKNNPDVERAYSKPGDIESLISGLFQQIHGVMVNVPTEGGIVPQVAALSTESYGTVANYGMALRNAIPRVAIQNGRGNQTGEGTFRDFREFSKLARSAATGITALDNLASPGLGSAGRNARARAFGFFSLGAALGNLALVYDSAAIVLPTTAVGEVPPLSSYKDVMAAALQQFDSAIAIANSSAGASSDFTMTDWIRGNTLNAAAFIRVVRSHKARFRAGVARTPTERTNVNWDQVIADATNGITADLNISTSNDAGWAQGWLASVYRYQGWGASAPFYVGMADTSGNFDQWLATPLLQRQQFLIRTPDKRFPSGNTRAAQDTASGTLPSGNLYFRNRPAGEDTPGDPFGNSQYDHYRFRGLVLNNANRIGTWPTFTKAENDMLAAEGYIRKGQIAEAAALIDITRKKNGLAELTGAVATASDPVPGGTACVPRVPVAPFNHTACGTIMEAMKYEKRLETAYTGYAQWWVDARGWGDLVEGSALQFPVPYQEMDARGTPFYDLGGVGAPSGAPKGTYGY